MGDCPEWIVPPVYISYENGKYIVIQPEWLYEFDFMKGGKYGDFSITVPGMP